MRLLILDGEKHIFMVRILGRFVLKRLQDISSPVIISPWNLYETYLKEPIVKIRTQTSSWKNVNSMTVENMSAYRIVYQINFISLKMFEVAYSNLKYSLVYLIAKVFSIKNDIVCKFFHSYFIFCLFLKHIDRNHPLELLLNILIALNSLPRLELRWLHIVINIA